LSVSDLPAVNALLNATSALLLVAGYRFIRRRRIEAHRLCMLLALLASALFLSSYLYHHARVGLVPFRGHGLPRFIYFAILIPHTVLAMAIVPLALVTVTRALRGDLERHVPIARATLPLWLFVSVTGVIVYLMLYHWPE
jgi:putative membrane protein